MKKLTKMYRFHLGYTLVEAILVAAVIVLLIGSVYSYYRYAHASEKGLEESTNVAMLTKSVADAYESMANFGNVSTATAISENLIPKNFTTTSNTLYSPNGYQVALASETLSGVAGRGFSVTYKSVDQQMCSALVANTNTMQKFVSIKVGSTQVGTRGTIDEAATATACKNAPVDVAFVYQRFGTGEVTDLDRCVVPSPQTKTLPCAPGYLGGIVQQRTAVCNGPYEIPVWNAWVTTSDTCAIACVVDPTSPETKTESCATGYLGLKTYKRVSTCAGPTGYPTWGAWTLESDTCLIACVVPAPIVVMENCRTKSGFGSDWTGTYVTTTEAACLSQTGSPSWKTPTVQNNCSKKCVAPAPTTALRTSTPCPSGQSGVITESQTTSWTCPSATGSPVSSTSAWTVVSNTCAATCTAPAPTAEAITRAAAPESQNVGCPYPQVGEHWQQRSRVENGTRTTSWTCPGPTPSTNDTWLGTYNYGAWTDVSNTCTSTWPYATGAAWIVELQSHDLDDSRHGSTQAFIYFTSTKIYFVEERMNIGVSNTVKQAIVNEMKAYILGTAYNGTYFGTLTARGSELASTNSSGSTQYGYTAKYTTTENGSTLSNAIGNDFENSAIEAIYRYYPSKTVSFSANDIEQRNIVEFSW